ncbi:hypothetical protein GNI_151370 [Gregarina niphandrodes]|uniref:Uncharacterized protein n=1 Tax=Gregarina niphandrodes TaxID=110365 RepID=A0A023AZJ9_GRENI|nr:hypothetical protein GNI_151370 [Gregarina niphandrodes]EZG44158.1 hypothetical protein GNI_151370 [Gregarina niphandrodes]|eukprot:XP_011132782.1 hypothetical protein GNI_151370 [Gregarina niphandrodes]
MDKTVISVPLPNKALFRDQPSGRLVLLFQNATWARSGDSAWASIQDIPISTVTSAPGNCPSAVVDRLDAFFTSTEEGSVEEDSKSEDGRSSALDRIQLHMDSVGTHDAVSLKAVFVETAEGQYTTTTERGVKEDDIAADIANEILLARKASAVAPRNSPSRTEFCQSGDDVFMVVPEALVTAQTAGHSRHTWIVGQEVRPRSRNNAFLLLDF